VGEPHSRTIWYQNFYFDFCAHQLAPTKTCTASRSLEHSQEIGIRSISGKQCSSDSLLALVGVDYISALTMPRERISNYCYIRPTSPLDARNCISKAHRNQKRKFSKEREINQGEKVVQLSNFFIIPPSAVKFPYCARIDAKVWDVCQRTTLRLNKRISLKTCCHDTAALIPLHFFSFFYCCDVSKGTWVVLSRQKKEKRVACLYFCQHPDRSMTPNITWTKNPPKTIVGPKNKKKILALSLFYKITKRI